MWAVTSKQGFIYIVDSANPCRTQHGGGDQQGRVNVFKPTASGSLQKLGFAEIGGRGPCHTCLHSSEAYIVVCCYESGSVTVLPISSSKELKGCCSLRYTCSMLLQTLLSVPLLVLLLVLLPMVLPMVLPTLHVTATPFKAEN